MGTKAKSAPKEAARGNKEKFASYREAFDRIKKAQEGGWYFEAVTLQESILSDRLQSHLLGTGVIKIEKRPKTLGTLVSKYKNNPCMPPDLYQRLNDWTSDRNKVVHEFAKSMPGLPSKDVESALHHAWHTAMNGDRIVRDVLKWFREQRARR